MVSDEPQRMVSHEPQIRSRQNRLIRWVRSLGSREERQRQGVTVLEGWRLVTEAQWAGVRLPIILYTPELATRPETGALLEAAVKAGSQVICVAPEALEVCAQTVTPQGIMAVAEFGERPLPATGEFVPARGVLVALDGVQDPGNVGTIVRAGLAAGVRGLLVGPGTADVSSPKTLRSSMGAVFRVPVWRVAAWDFLPRLKQQGWRLVAARARDGVPPYAVDLAGGVVIMLGSEARGLPPALEQFADLVVSIPMPGGAESLNVAMAGTILLYESVRQQAVVRPPGV